MLEKGNLQKGNKQASIFAVENITASYSRNETNSSNVNIQDKTTIDTRASISYNYSSKPKI